MLVNGTRQEIGRIWTPARWQANTLPMYPLGRQRWVSPHGTVLDLSGPRPRSYPWPYRHGIECAGGIVRKRGRPYWAATGEPVPIRGGVGMSAYWQHGASTMAFPWSGNVSAAPGATNYLLDSLYDPDNATPAGDGVGYRWRLIAAKTLSTVYFNVASESAPSPDTIDVELRIGDRTKPTSGAGNLIATATSGAIAVGWNSVALSASFAAASYRWICVGNKAWISGSHTVNKNWNSPLRWEDNTTGLDAYSLRTADGWTTVANGQSGRCAMIVLVFSDSTITGNPFGATSNTFFTNNTLYRGLSIDGITESLKVMGFVADQQVNWATASMFEGAALPDAPTQTGTLLNFAFVANDCVCVFDNRPVTLAKNTAYRFAVKTAANNQRPSVMSIGTGADANLRAAMPGANNWKATQEIAGPAWSDTADTIPAVTVLVEEQVAVTGGAGGGPLVGGRLTMGG